MLVQLKLCPPSCPKSSTRMQTTAAWTGAKFGCKLGNSLRRVHLGSILQISNSKHPSMGTIEIALPTYCLDFVCALECACVCLNVHICVSAYRCTWQDRSDNSDNADCALLVLSQHTVGQTYSKALFSSSSASRFIALNVVRYRFSLWQSNNIPLCRQWNFTLTLRPSLIFFHKLSRRPGCKPDSRPGNECIFTGSDTVQKILAV